jgi:hypothetical protein
MFFIPMGSSPLSLSPKRKACVWCMVFPCNGSSRTWSCPECHRWHTPSPTA